MKKKTSRASKMIQGWIWLLLSKLGDPSVIHRTHVMEGVNWLQNGVVCPLYSHCLVCADTYTVIHTSIHTERKERGAEKRKKKSKPLNSFYDYITTQNQMAIMEEKKVQDDNTNELTGKYPQQNNSKMDWTRQLRDYPLSPTMGHLWNHGGWFDIYKSLCLIYNIGRMGKNHMTISTCAEDH